MVEKIGGIEEMKAEDESMRVSKTEHSSFGPRESDGIQLIVLG